MGMALAVVATVALVFVAAYLHEQSRNAPLRDDNARLARENAELRFRLGAVAHADDATPLPFAFRGWDGGGVARG